LLVDLDDRGIVAQWIIDFSREWEQKYQERVNQHRDMSQRIRTAMEKMKDLDPDFVKHRPLVRSTGTQVTGRCPCHRVEGKKAWRDEENREAEDLKKNHCCVCLLRLDE
jgi:hypothetical protein